MRQIIKNNFGKSKNRRASFVIEYVTIIAIIALALITMQFYLKRSMSGSLRNTADVFGQGRQYEPGVTVVTEN
ncbi:MAG: hypothetical protein PHG69_05565 [Candidatus Omnitrophica bacterium]|nr:hypothetical protein [Candidatus Omnitrophota bacterium]